MNWFHHSRLAHHTVIWFLIIALFVITAFLLHPLKRLSHERDLVRQKNVQEILASLQEYKSIHDNDLPEGIDQESAFVQQIGTLSSGCANLCGGRMAKDSCLDLSVLNEETYLTEMPKDPISGSEEKTGYYVNLTSSGRLVVGACYFEENSIEVKQ